MKYLKSLRKRLSPLIGLGISVIAFIAVLGMGPTAYAEDPPAAPAPTTCQQYLLTFPAWYRGITDSSCQVQIDELNDFIKIPLNVLEIFVQVVAYAATGFIVWGGFKYMKSQGEPSKISEAKMAILQAVIGLVIALASVAIVRFVQGRIL